MAALGFGLTGFGLILVWAGVKGEDLREVIPAVFSGNRKLTGSKNKTNAITGAPLGSSTPTPGGNNAGVPYALTTGATSATAPTGTVR